MPRLRRLIGEGDTRRGWGSDAVARTCEACVAPPIRRCRRHGLRVKRRWWVVGISVARRGLRERS